MILAPETTRQIFCYLYEILPVTSVIKPPPPVGAGGGYMFSGHPSVPLSVHPSVIHVVVLCFRDISSICWRIFAKLLSLVHLGTQMTWLRFWVKRSKFKVTPSRRRRTALDATVECNFFLLFVWNSSCYFSYLLRSVYAQLYRWQVHHA